MTPNFVSRGNLYFGLHLPKDIVSGEEAVWRLGKSEVLKNSKEILFSKHNRTELTETVRAHKTHTCSDRQNPSAEKGKWAQSLTLTQEAACSWYLHGEENQYSSVARHWAHQPCLKLDLMLWSSWPASKGLLFLKSFLFKEKVKWTDRRSGRSWGR